MVFRYPLIQYFLLSGFVFSWVLLLDWGVGVRFTEMPSSFSLFLSLSQVLTCPILFLFVFFCFSWVLFLAWGVGLCFHGNAIFSLSFSPSLVLTCPIFFLFRFCFSLVLFLAWGVGVGFMKMVSALSLSLSICLSLSAILHATTLSRGNHMLNWVKGPKWDLILHLAGYNKGCWVRLYSLRCIEIIGRQNLITPYSWHTLSSKLSSKDAKMEGCFYVNFWEFFVSYSYYNHCRLSYCYMKIDNGTRF